MTVHQPSEPHELAPNLSPNLALNLPPNPVQQRRLIIALDGPAGSGKSTTARLVAERLGYLYIDTGAMYRAITLAALREGVFAGEPENGTDSDRWQIDEEMMQSVLAKYTVRLSVEAAPLFAHATSRPTTLQRTYLLSKSQTDDVQEVGDDVSDDIRSQDVTLRVSTIAALQSVREAMVAQQRALGAAGGVVMDGRDIGTVVFPQAHLKIFLVASVQERARRRLLELQATTNRKTAAAAANVPTFDELCEQLAERDRQDSERAISPLRKAADALEIDTSSLTIEEQTAHILALATAIMNPQTTA